MTRGNSTVALGNHRQSLLQLALQDRISGFEIRRDGFSFEQSLSHDVFLLIAATYLLHLDVRIFCSANVPMAVETLGEAWQLGWRIKARCDFGKHDGMRSIRECTYSADLDLRTLVMTRGLSFPLSDLASRLKCPACASRKMRLIYSVPGKPHAAEASRRNYG